MMLLVTVAVPLVPLVTRLLVLPTRTPIPDWLFVWIWVIQLVVMVADPLPSTYTPAFSNAPLVCPVISNLLMVTPVAPLMSTMGWSPLSDAGAWMIAIGLIWVGEG